jgi:hypothetical protein
MSAAGEHSDKPADMAADKHVEERLLAHIEALRSRGAERLDPMRLVQLEALFRRQADQPEPVRVLVRKKLESALAQLQERLDQAPKPISTRTEALPRNAPKPAPRKPMSTSKSAPAAGWGLPPQATEELASVSRFRRAWSGIRAQDSVVLASSQKPNNAGPLNSHVLIAQSLDMMQALPGDYLRRFVTHAESLLWLEANVTQNTPSTARKTKRASRSKM